MFTLKFLLEKNKNKNKYPQLIRVYIIIIAVSVDKLAAFYNFAIIKNLLSFMEFKRCTYIASGFKTK